MMTMGSYSLRVLRSVLFTFTLSILCTIASGIAFQNAYAKDEAKNDAFDTKYKIVIQISTDDETTRTTAINNAVNLQQLYGMDNVTVEIVAYGPGLSVLTKKSKQAERIKSLATQNIIFSACNNTMTKIEKKTGKKPQLIEGVGVVPAGVARIVELQMQGYSYVRP